VSESFSLGPPGSSWVVLGPSGALRETARTSEKQNASAQVAVAQQETMKNKIPEPLTAWGSSVAQYRRNSKYAYAQNIVVPYDGQRLVETGCRSSKY
jgi:hypothetical protein